MQEEEQCDEGKDSEDPLHTYLKDRLASVQSSFRMIGQRTSAAPVHIPAASHWPRMYVPNAPGPVFML
jgi:hypothetical protein